jgi:hypothetical protein
MTFIFAEAQGMLSAAANVADLAADTASAAGQAGGCVAVAPGLDACSVATAAKINTYTKQVASGLANGAGLQVHYGESVSGAANAYVLTDQLNATGLGASGQSV